MTRQEDAVVLLRMIEYARAEASLLGLPAVAAPLHTAVTELTREIGAEAAASIFGPAQTAKN